MEEIVKQYGFDSLTEFHKMVAAIDLSTMDDKISFRVWKDFDGTKEGLLKLKTIT